MDAAQAVLAPVGLRLMDIRTDGGTQARAQLSEDESAQLLQADLAEACLRAINAEWAAGGIHPWPLGGEYGDGDALLGRSRDGGSGSGG